VSEGKWAVDVDHAAVVGGRLRLQRTVTYGG
jgi:hypothetical protein